MIIVDESRNIQSLLLWLLDEMIDNKITFLSRGHTKENKTLSISITDSEIMKFISFGIKYKDMGIKYIQFLFKLANENKIISFHPVGLIGNERSSSRTLVFSYIGEIDELNVDLRP